MATNRLSRETSPYLLQHAENPVDWYAWGPEALAAARDSGRPILLSIGYAACHWCHVMAHESFENPEIAAVMNDLFVNVKVDREERPDLDAIYQSALALLGQQGGWPLTMLLTPAGEPFWGGTYFPPDARFGRPGFADVLRAIAETCRQNPDRVAQNVAALGEALARQAENAAGEGVPREALDAVAERLVAEVDPVRGGLGGAP
ncbi:MAG: thioredoxin domain-containing protein, partial [Inquilinus sp.]|nr:thioredoxin domain-containing protein [Inquilinus sp.]